MRKILQTDKPSKFDPLSAVMQAATANVDTVLIAGRVVKQGGNLLADGLTEKMSALQRSGETHTVGLQGTAAARRLSRGTIAGLKTSASGTRLCAGRPVRCEGSGLNVASRRRHWRESGLLND